MDTEEKPKSSLDIVVMADKLFNNVTNKLTPKELEVLIDECAALNNSNHR